MHAVALNSVTVRIIPILASLLHTGIVCANSLYFVLHSFALGTLEVPFIWLRVGCLHPLFSSILNVRFCRNAFFVHISEVILFLYLHSLTQRSLYTPSDAICFRTYILIHCALSRFFIILPWRNAFFSYAFCCIVSCSKLSFLHSVAICMIYVSVFALGQELARPGCHRWPCSLRVGLG